MPQAMQRKSMGYYNLTQIFIKYFFKTCGRILAARFLTFNQPYFWFKLPVIIAINSFNFLGKGKSLSFLPLALTISITPEYFPNVIKRSIELGYYQQALIILLWLTMFGKGSATAISIRSQTD